MERAPDRTRNRPDAGRKLRRGSVLLWALFAISMLVALGALIVDWGRIVLAKSELQQATDAAARYGTLMLEIDPAQAMAAANTALNENPVDGRIIPMARRTIEIGQWNPIDENFTVLPANNSNVNAVRVVVRLEADTADGVETSFADFFGGGTAAVYAESIAALQGQIYANTTVPASSNPWLAGSPAGTISNPFNPHDNPDVAGSDDTSDERSIRKASPLRVTGLNLGNGGPTELSFFSINGGAAYDPSLVLSTPDGTPNTSASNRYAKGLYDSNLNPLRGQSQGSYNVQNLDIPQADGTIARNGGENGKSNIRAPYNSLIAVFLGPAVPQVGQEPGSINFTEDGIDFTRLEPELNQIFFVGDGRNADGTEQVFEVPAGATRLYLGVMDSYEWGNNQGGYQTVIKQPGRVTLVR